MKLAIISDIHANLEALQATLQQISAQTVDRIVCLGDIVGYNANPEECISLLRELDVLSIAGNHDRAVTGQITTEGSHPYRRLGPLPGRADNSARTRSSFLPGCR